MIYKIDYNLLRSIGEMHVRSNLHDLMYFPTLKTGTIILSFFIIYLEKIVYFAICILKSLILSANIIINLKNSNIFLFFSINKVILRIL